MALRDLTKKFRTIRDGEQAKVKAERVARGLDDDDLGSNLLKVDLVTTIMISTNVNHFY